MGRKQLFRIIIGISAIMALTLVLGSSAGATEHKTLHKFKQTGVKGSQPSAGLIFDAAGNLYGTTGSGGAYAYYGTVFELTPNADGSWTESVLHSFNSSDGSRPVAGLIFDAAGNLYGTTSEGGAYRAGTVFELTPNADGSWTESVLHSFNGSDGSRPAAGLIFDAAGNLYGTTLYGGADGFGAVFKLAPNGDGSWTESVLHSFKGHNGKYPQPGLIFDAAGNLYGTTLYSGADGFGAVFKLAPNGDGSWTESVLHSFNGNDGDYSTAGLTFDAAGNLYGTTGYGGADNYGVVFKLRPMRTGEWRYHVLHSFQNRPGAHPWAGLVLDQAGNLYGTTAGDETTTFGSVFEITLSPDSDLE